MVKNMYQYKTFRVKIISFNEKDYSLAKIREYFIERDHLLTFVQDIFNKGENINGKVMLSTLVGGSVQWSNLDGAVGMFTPDVEIYGPHHVSSYLERW